MAKGREAPQALRLHLDRIACRRRSPRSGFGSCSGYCLACRFFNIFYALRLKSEFDAAVLERSLNEIVRRHEILRTTFAVVDGQYLQVIAPHLPVHLRFDDLHTFQSPRRTLPDSEQFERKFCIASTLFKDPCFGFVCYA